MHFTVDKCELNPAYVIKNIDSQKIYLMGKKNGPHQRTVLVIDQISG